MSASEHVHGHARNQRPDRVANIDTSPKVGSYAGNDFPEDAREDACGSGGRHIGERHRRRERKIVTIPAGARSGGQDQ
jgi:hypothetical protein